MAQTACFMPSFYKRSEKAFCLPLLLFFSTELRVSNIKQLEIYETMNKRLTNSEKKEFNNLLENRYGLRDFIIKNDIVDIKDNLVFINNRKLFFNYSDILLPTLHLLLEKLILKKVTVDMGAVKFVIKGADIMRPGIRTLDENIAKDEFVVIVDETHGKPLAVGKLLFSGEEIKVMNSGKVIKNIHWIGDEMWK